ncbi:MAG: DMT family transporter [Lachnospiraceae bacterium]|nr:DMT family transporter [Lachnospiraceae bacterium]
MSTSFRGVVYAIISTAGFGITSFLAAVMVNLGADSNAVTLLQYVLPIFTFVLLMKVNGVTLSLKEVPWVALFINSAFSALAMLMLNASYNYLPVSTTICIHYLYPILAALVGVLYFREKMSKAVASALIIAFAGIALFIDPSEGAGTGVGYILAFFSAVMWMLYVVTLEHTRLNGMESHIYNLISGILSIPVILVVIFMSGGFNFSGFNVWIWFLGILMATADALGMILLKRSITLIGSTMFSVFGPMEPIVSSVLGFVILKDPVNFRSVMGCIMVLLAVVIAAVADYRKEKAET